MAYIGNTPAESFASFEKQVFTIVNSQTAYTLSHSVVNENDIRLVVNNVVQEPGSGKAYTASGTTLTLSAALVNGTDEMYCVILGRALQTVNPPNASVGTAQLGSDAVTGAKIVDDAISDEHLDPTIITGQTAETSIATDDLILLSDTSASGALKKMTRANFVSGVGGDNTPAFLAYANADQGSISGNTFTKLTNYGVEVFDTDNTFSSSRWTPGVVGKYFVYATVYGQTNNGYRSFFNVYVNGSNYQTSSQTTGSSDNHPQQVTAIVDVTNTSDYIEVYYNNTYTGGATTVYSSGVEVKFGGFKIIT